MMKVWIGQVVGIWAVASTVRSIKRGSNFANRISLVAV